MGSSGPFLKTSQEANSNCFCGSRGPLPCYLKTLDSKQRQWSSSYEYSVHRGHSVLIPNRSTQTQDFLRPCKRSRRGNQWDHITCNGTHIHSSRKSLAYDDWANLPLLNICFKTRDCNHLPPTTTNRQEPGLGSDLSSASEYLAQPWCLNKSAAEAVYSHWQI